MRQGAMASLICLVLALVTGRAAGAAETQRPLGIRDWRLAQVLNKQARELYLKGGTTPKQSPG